MKHIAEEICQSNVSEGSLKVMCGAISVTQCASCTVFLCEECGQICKNCRDHAVHHVYCKGCINTHKCPGEITEQDVRA